MCCAAVPDTTCCGACCPADDGELLSWDLSSLTPQARERQSSRAYMDSGEDSDEGSDGEGPIFKGTTVYGQKEVVLSSLKSPSCICTMCLLSLACQAQS
jgi:hypothetical protein